MPDDDHREEIEKKGEFDLSKSVTVDVFDETGMDFEESFISEFRHNPDFKIDIEYATDVADIVDNEYTQLEDFMRKAIAAKRARGR